MRKIFYSILAGVALSACTTIRPVSDMNVFVARYSNGYLLDSDWEVIGFARNGFLLNERNEVVGRYANGYAYDCLDSVIAVYGNGCVYSDRSLWDIYDRMDMSNYIKDQKGKE